MAPIANNHPHGKRFARLQITKSGLAQYIDMQKHIFRAAKDICKPKTLGLVEPFHTGGLELGGGKLIGIKSCEFDHGGGRLTGGRDGEHLDRLRAAIGLLHPHRHPRPISDRALAEIAQDIDVQQYVSPARVGHDKAEAFERIEPFDHALKGIV